MSNASPQDAEPSTHLPGDSAAAAPPAPSAQQNRYSYPVDEGVRAARRSWGPYIIGAGGLGMLGGACLGYFLTRRNLTRNKRFMRSISPEKRKRVLSDHKLKVEGFRLGMRALGISTALVFGSAAAFGGYLHYRYNIPTWRDFYLLTQREMVIPMSERIDELCESVGLTRRQPPTTQNAEDEEAERILMAAIEGQFPDPRTRSVASEQADGWLSDEEHAPNQQDE